MSAEKAKTICIGGIRVILTATELRMAQGYEHTAIVPRREIKELLAGNRNVLTARCTCSATVEDRLDVNFLPRGEAQVGCKRFSRRAVQAIRKWANGYTRKANKARSTAKS